MNDLQVLTYNGTDLRTLEMGDEMWWVLKDVCNVLTIADHISVAKRLDDDEKGVGQIHTPGGAQNVVVVNEPGLYNVILRSDKPEAKDFKRWVTHEVLPTIHRTGMYSAKPSLSTNELVLMMAQSNVEMEKRVNEQAAQLAELTDKVDNALKVYARPSEDHWRDDMDKAVKQLREDMGWALPKLQGALYAELEDKAGANIQSRLTRLRQRMRKTGMRYRDSMALTKLDAVAADKHMRCIFEGLVREWQARALTPDPDQMAIEPEYVQEVM